jgi:BirA family biotin operon repressor/biotin-[acetyl-CoA-carboxylase] ligase
VNFSQFVSGLEAQRRDRPSQEPDELLAVPVADSTNLLARRLAESFENETEMVPSLLVLALEQTGGRGRRGRTWSSPAGCGVYASRVLHSASLASLQRLPLLTGVGLAAGLAEATDLPVRLKWPNDLVVEVAGRRRKLGGVLIETWSGASGELSACIGFGINLSHSAEELPEAGISLRQLGVERLDLAQLAWSLALGLERELARREEEEDVTERYRALSVHRPGEPLTCALPEGEVSGTFEGFDEAGRLRLATAAGERLLAAGEVIER